VSADDPTTATRTVDRNAAPESPATDPQASTRPAGPADAREAESEADPDTRVDALLEPASFDSTVERVPRLSGGVWIALGVASIGIAVREPVLVVAATIPLWHLAYGALTGMGEVEVAVARECPDVATRPGERIPVRLTVENVGDDPISDLRIVDGAPADLPVVDGSPRGCVALGPGERATVEYELAARRGSHRFDEVRLRARNLVGTVVETGFVEAGGTDELTCQLPVESVPLSDQTARQAGRVTADEGGRGIEFHAVREYQRGDPIGSIDWRRYAHTGELTTVEYRSDRSAVVGAVVDARPEMYVAPESEAPAAAATAAYAADRAIDSLAAAGFPTALFPVTDDVGGVIGPGSDTKTVHRARGRLAELQADDPDWSSLYRDSWSVLPSDLADLLFDRLPGHATVLVFSPAIDEFPANLCRGLVRHGYEVTLVSPDVTGDDDMANRVRHVQRRDRLVALRSAGVHVVDWDPEDPLAAALEAAIGGGERR